MDETLKVKIYNGRLVRDTAWLGQMDPYCLVKVGETTQRTKTCVSGGRFPMWQFMYSFHVKEETEIEVQCWDKNFFRKDTLIGTASLEISQVVSAQFSREYVPIYYEGKQSGELKIELDCRSEAADSELAIRRSGTAEEAQHSLSPVTDVAPQQYRHLPVAHPAVYHGQLMRQHTAPVLTHFAPAYHGNYVPPHPVHYPAHRQHMNPAMRPDVWGAYPTPTRRYN